MASHIPISPPTPSNQPTNKQTNETSPATTAGYLIIVKIEIGSDRALPWRGERTFAWQDWLEERAVELSSGWLVAAGWLTEWLVSWLAGYLAWWWIQETKKNRVNLYYLLQLPSRMAELYICHFGHCPIPCANKKLPLRLTSQRSLHRPRQVTQLTDR